MSDEVSTSIKLPTFDGKDENLSMWWTRFQAFAAVNNFTEALDIDGDIPALKLAADALDATDVANKPKLLAVRKNNFARVQLTMAFETQRLLSLLDTVKDSILCPQGLSRKVVTALKEKYQPNDMISAVQLKRRLNQIEMGEYEDPKNLFEKIATIRNEYSET